MRKLIFFLIAITGCFLLANAMVNDSGYVLVTYDNMSFESSLWATLLLLMVMLFSVWIVMGLVHFFIGASTMIYPWSQSAKQKKAQHLSVRGLAEFSHGHWKKAERLLAQAAESGETPLINYLAAARAAHEAGNNAACAEYLRRADYKAPGADIAVGITQAQLQLSGGQLEQALATLKHLRKKNPNHAFILKLLKQAYTRLHDWQSLALLLPALRKQKVLDDAQLRKLESEAYGALFEQAYRQGRSQTQLEEKVATANAVWRKLSKQQQREPGMLFRYTQTLTLLGAEEKAERLLRDKLVKYYTVPLINLYGKIKGADTRKQLLSAEALLNERPNDSHLLLALGRLAMGNELWGKAREYFEASLRLKKSVDVYNELGRLLAHLDDYEKSSYYFREGLKTVSCKLL